jgi:hypothetical protein
MGHYADKLEEQFSEYCIRAKLAQGNGHDIENEDRCAIPYYLALSKLIQQGLKYSLVQLLRERVPCPPELLPILGDVINELATKKLDDGKTPKTVYAESYWLYFQMKSQRSAYDSESAMFQSFATLYGDPNTGLPTPSFFRHIWTKSNADPWLSNLKVDLPDTP